MPDVANSGGIERIEFGDRGLGQYGTPVPDTYGRAEIEVSDSSAALCEACWLRISGEAHLSESPRAHAGLPWGVARAQVAAHLDIESAQGIIDRLQAWIDRSAE